MVYICINSRLDEEVVGRIGEALTGPLQVDDRVDDVGDVHAFGPSSRAIASASIR
jgi:hypothetical protein